MGLISDQQSQLRFELVSLLTGPSSDPKFVLRDAKLLEEWILGKPQTPLDSTASID